MPPTESVDGTWAPPPMKWTFRIRTDVASTRSTRWPAGADMTGTDEPCRRPLLCLEDPELLPSITTSVPGL